MSGFCLVDAAIDELEDAAAYYAAQSERISLDLRDEISRALGHLVDFPNAAPSIDATHLSYNLRRFPYHLIYQIESDEFVIVAVAHTSREPEYWRGRS